MNGGLILLSALLSVLALRALMALFNLLLAPRLDAPPAHAQSPVNPMPPQALSLLIPARNERHALSENLPGLVDSLSSEPELQGRKLEILILDDESTDGMSEWLEGWISENSRTVRFPIRRLVGKPLPPGWVGKNWACHQLSQEAHGDLLVFLDADVRATGRAVRFTCQWMERARWDVLTALPHQRMGSWTELAVLPLIMHLPILTLVPLRLLPRIRGPRCIVANGQWLALTRQAYQLSGGHAGVRTSAVEDMALIRALKSRAPDSRSGAVLAPRELSVRMYSGWESLRDGFTKNLYPLLGNRPAPVVILTCLWLATDALPWALAALQLTYAPLVLLISLRLMASIAFRMSLGAALGSLFLHPLGVILCLRILWRSARAKRLGGLNWKGRTLPSSRLA